MNKLYKYTFKNVVNKKSLWIVNGLVWLFYAIILIILPNALGLDYITIWSNSMFNVNMLTIIFIAIYCGILAVCVFNQPKEDGTDLLIFSKPISRWKVIISKFCVYLTFIAINIAGCMIIPLFCFCAGPYDHVTRPQGYQAGKIGWMEVSIFTASTVISLVYGSIAILISLKFSKQIILVSTIAIAVFFQVVQTVIPLVAPTPRELGKSKYAINMCTGNFFDREVEDTKCFMYQENGITTGDYDFEYTTNELNHKLQSASGLGVINMFDVSGQFASLYNLGKLNPYRDADIAAYSLSPTVKYITTPEDAVFSNPLDPQIDPSTGKFLPKMAPEYDTENEPEHWSYKIYGQNQTFYQFFQMIGCDRYATACISDLNNPLDSVFLSDAKQEFTDPNGKNVITEQKVDDVYQDEGCYEYAHIRDSALNYILNGVKPEGFSGELTNQGHWIVWWCRSALDFLYNPVHLYSDPDKVLYETGYEAVNGKPLNDSTSTTDFILAELKFFKHMSYDLWNFYYGVNLDSLAMSKELLSGLGDNPFITKLIEYLNEKHPDPWPVYDKNKDPVSNEEFCNKYRFLFYSGSLDLLRKDGSDGRVNSSYGHFVNCVFNTCMWPTSQPALIYNPEFADKIWTDDIKKFYSSDYETTWHSTVIPSIASMLSATLYKTTRYVSAEPIIIFWVLAALLLFSCTVLIYWKSDIK